MKKYYKIMVDENTEAFWEENDVGNENYGYMLHGLALDFAKQMKCPYCHQKLFSSQEYFYCLNCD